MYADAPNDYQEMELFHGMVESYRLGSSFRGSLKNVRAQCSVPRFGAT